ncbi:MAG: carboxylating nicotinate-nucleotide diphosphorylase [Gammaproteobacteria bacterium]|nr:carboxylating nicotinate-nucleotide diphosphorylase [Gammaproteobacteria bacterium]
MDIVRTVQYALAEDIGAGDLSAELLPSDLIVTAKLVSRQDAVLCGIQWFEQTFVCVDSTVDIAWHASDGDDINNEQVLCVVKGSARNIVTAERTALNFVQTLSGTATTTKRYVQALRGTKARILDTRKTLPGLRHAQKYAVRCGGATNHRMGLYDGILIKENHINAAGSITAALGKCRRHAIHGRLVEVEVETLAELHEALAAGATRILLDNFDLEEMTTAVNVNDGRAELEASGMVTLKNVRAIAKTGVDYISVGALTKHVSAVDLSLRID